MIELIALIAGWVATGVLSAVFYFKPKLGKKIADSVDDAQDVMEDVSQAVMGLAQFKYHSMAGEILEEDQIVDFAMDEELFDYEAEEEDYVVTMGDNMMEKYDLSN